VTGALGRPHYGVPMTSPEPPETAESPAPAARATELLRLQQAPELLTLVNVWDVVSARVVADIEGTVALATASHSIAASRGYEDGENIPVDEMITEVGLIAAATSLPVTADLEGGYGDAAATVRRAIGVGVVGANIEDQMKPVAEAAAQVEAVMRAAAAEGIDDFVLNARTDAFLELLKGNADDPAAVLADTVERGRAFLDAGAPSVFVPGILDEEQVATLVDAFGAQRLTTIGIPGNPDNARLQELGVARVSYGPIPQRVALTALAELVEGLRAGGGVPQGTRALN
jgi:2-methylisocitrate lyase-like PEP mutase family enzyme